MSLDDFLETKNCPICHRKGIGRFYAIPCNPCIDEMKRRHNAEAQDVNRILDRLTL